MAKRRILLLLLLLAMALVPRLATQWWDAGLPSSHHPDERQVVFVAERMAGWFSDPGFYAYGSLHFQAVRGAAALVPGADGFKRLLIGGRLVSLAASMLALLIGWWLARRFWSRRSALLFLLLAAWVPLDIQQAHFATVEAHHSAWIMLALAGAAWLGVRGSRPAAVLAGAAAGCSLAVKVASLGLVFPLALAVLLAGRGRSFARLLELAGIALTAALLAFWLAQPWAMAGGGPPLVLLAAGAMAVLLARFAGELQPGWGRRAPLVFATLLLGATAALLVSALSLTDPTGVPTVAPAFGERIGPIFNAAYLKGVGEQVAMVTGAADLPYVRVYRAAPVVLYPLGQLLLWGLGPLLLLAVIGGTVRGLSMLGGRWRRWLGGSWTPGMALLAVLLAWLGPMSLRLATLHVKYLRYWEPLIVPAVMLAAWALDSLPRGWRRLAVPLVVGGTVLWGVTYLWGFAEPHPHRTAGRWLSEMTEPDQTVAFEHWDETVPVSGVRSVELPSYELPDDDAKVRQWCRALASADWVVLTSNRVRRTVLANPDLYPRTGRLYRLLLAGEAGFEPLTRVDRAPRLFGIARNVQRADESFLNYDFPRVVVLRRVRQVDVQALVERSRRPLPFLEELGSTGLEARFVVPLPALRAVPTAGRQVIDLGVWMLVFALLTAAAWGYLLPVVRSWPDAGIAMSLVTGWLVPSWSLWLGSELGLWPVGPAKASVILLGVTVGGAVVLWRRRRLAARLWGERRRFILATLAAAAVVGGLFLVARAINPAIYWGEKPMDFSFLNAFLRASSWPPGEPWMAGMPLHYYYFGEVLASFPMLAANVEPAVGYNLMAATVPALAAALLAAFGLAVARRRTFAAAGLLPLLTLVTGNLQWPFLGEIARQWRWFDLWWATSRVVPGFAIDEYPLWTALFADLHGHFIALPVLLLCLAWGWHTVRLERCWMVAAALCGLSAGVLVATNPWDLFVLAAALGIGTLAAAAAPWRGLGRLLVAGGFSMLATLPFVLELVGGIRAGAGGRLLLLTRQDFAPAWAILRHFGVFLVPVLALAVAVLWRRRLLLAMVPVAVAAGLLGMVIPSSAAAVCLAAGVLLAATAAADRDDRGRRLAWTLAALAMAAVAACERITLIDRMNTLFKVYNGVWVLLAVALGVLLLRTVDWRRQLLLLTWLPLEVVALVNLPLGLAQGWLEPRIASPRPTLDGQAYLHLRQPQTWFLVRALEGMARPGDVVAEAAKTAYAEYTRIAMHTGQPTVVGWEWHLQQRGQSVEEVKARYADLALLYGGSDAAARRQVLDRYRVRWVVLGDLERTTYGLEGQDPLSGVPGVVALLRRDGATLYQVLPAAGAAYGTASLPGPMRMIPAGLRVLGTVPVVRSATVRSLAMDGDGATAVLQGGGVMTLDVAGRQGVRPPAAPCPAVGVARREGSTWLACDDGRVLSLDGGAWRSTGRVDGASGLAAGDELWAFGPGGLWRHAGRSRWRRVDRRAVVAAAASGKLLAIATSDAVYTSSGAGWQRTETDLGGVRALAWQGATLWAMTDGAVLRSGGGALPWRRPFTNLGAASTLAASGSRLWLVLADGALVENTAPSCGSPWLRPADGGPLEEPRGLAVSPDGWFAVADTRHHRVVWFSYRGSCLDLFGRQGAAAGEFREPSGLALSPGGDLAVADTWNGRLQVLSHDGSLAVVGDGLYGPRDLVWAEDGSLLAADTGNRRLVLYLPRSWKRQEVHAFEAPVVGLARVDGLLAAATPSAGEVVLLDPNDWSEVRRLRVPGWAGGDQQEGYLAVGPGGRLLASAPGPGEVWALDVSGGEPPRLVHSGVTGVTAMAVLPDGQILASQTPEGRLLRFRVQD